MQNFIGQSLGRYHITEKLGEGGMATVYKAYDTRLERDVAIKVIRREAFSQEIIDRMLKRFEREAKAMAKLSHNNIVKVLDYGEHEGNPFFVMELLSGGTLKESLGKPTPWREAVLIIEPIARALAYAHSENILHRDVKPANILITKTGEPVLTDFGIAKLLDIEEGNTLTGTGVGVGTPEYMAPEQGLGKEVDGRADIYALGIVFYELITGRKPYTAETPLAVLLKQVNDPLPDPGNFLPDLPVEVKKIIFKALAKEPVNRYQNMNELVIALSKLEQNNNKIQTKPGLHTPNKLQTRIDEFATTDEFDNGGRQEALPKLKIGAKAKKRIIFSRKIGFFVLGGILLLVVVFGIFNGWFLKPFQDNPVTALTPGSIETTSSLGIGSTKESEVDGMTLLFVPEGNFSMGSSTSDGNANELPNHIVYLDAYWIDQTEVTNAMYQKCVESGNCTPPSSEKSFSREVYFTNSLFSDYPVIHVSWEQANNYCEWAGRALPTEAQWEKAARGTDKRLYPWGNDPIIGSYANYADSSTNYLWSDKNNFDNHIETAGVKSFVNGKSPYNALNMSGNVLEWVNDKYGAKYYFIGPLKNPEGPATGAFRVVRGGSWKNDADSLITTHRYGVSPTNSADDLGFRCALDNQ